MHALHTPGHAAPDLKPKTLMRACQARGRWAGPRQQPTAAQETRSSRRLCCATRSRPPPLPKPPHARSAGTATRPGSQGRCARCVPSRCLPPAPGNSFDVQGLGACIERRGTDTARLAKELCQYLAWLLSAVGTKRGFQDLSGIRGTWHHPAWRCSPSASRKRVACADVGQLMGWPMPGSAWLRAQHRACLVLASWRGVCRQRGVSSTCQT